MHVASESVPGENIGYQLARYRIEGVIVYLFIIVYNLMTPDTHTLLPTLSLSLLLVA